MVEGMVRKDGSKSRTGGGSSWGRTRHRPAKPTHRDGQWAVGESEAWRPRAFGNAREFGAERQRCVPKRASVARKVKGNVGVLYSVGQKLMEQSVQHVEVGSQT